MTFGKSIGGGRRVAQRERAPVHVSFSTLARTQSVVLADFSPTGARLRGENMPAAGEEMVLTVGPLRTFAVTAWSKGNECGLEFDRPLPADIMAAVRVSFAISGCWTRELQQAFEDWHCSVAGR